MIVIIRVIEVYVLKAPEQKLHESDSGKHGVVVPYCLKHQLVGGFPVVLKDHDPDVGSQVSLSIATDWVEHNLGYEVLTVKSFSCLILEARGSH